MPVGKEWHLSGCGTRLYVDVTYHSNLCDLEKILPISCFSFLVWMKQNLPQYFVRSDEQLCTIWHKVRDMAAPSVSVTIDYWVFIHLFLSVTMANTTIKRNLEEKGGSVWLKRQVWDSKQESEAGIMKECCLLCSLTISTAPPTCGRYRLSQCPKHDHRSFYLGNYSNRPFLFLGNCSPCQVQNKN